jgi:magnesium-transporting ATPase (P-type)
MQEKSSELRYGLSVLNQQKTTSEYKDLSVEETLRIQDSSVNGLTELEAANRARKFGLNEVPEKSDNSVLAFLSRYWGPMPWLLELAIVLSFVLKHYLESGIIFVLLTINTVIGYIQSRGSQRVLEALKKRLAIQANVLRDGKWENRAARTLVPGDIISIGLGDIVPADTKLVSGELSIDQSILTGESFSVDDQPSAIIYAGSIVKRGEAKCLVINTGANTYFGKTAELVKIAKPKSHQEQIMLSVVKYMMFLGIIALVLVGSTGDNIAIAREMARQVGIGSRIIRIENFRKLSDIEQARWIEESDGLAEIYPEDKYRIVKLLQNKGHMVGMTGDGVNDAPALKQAEMGIAVSSATDVAKASASMVLTEAGTGVIIEAIISSRHIYQRMLTWVINKVTKVIQLIGLLTIGFFWFHDLVVSLLGMVLLIFANDFVTMSLSTDNVKHTANPNKWNVRNITFASLIIGALLVIEGVIALYLGQYLFHLEWEQLRIFTVLMLIFTSQFRVYVVRERNYFWSSLPGRELLIATVGTIIGFALLGVYGIFVTALTPWQVLFSLGFSAIFTLAIDFPKYLAFKKFGL